MVARSMNPCPDGDGQTWRRDVVACLVELDPRNADVARPPGGAGSAARVPFACSWGLPRAPRVICVPGVTNLSTAAGFRGGFGLGGNAA